MSKEEKQTPRQYVLSQFPDAKLKTGYNATSRKLIKYVEMRRGSIKCWSETSRGAWIEAQMACWEDQGLTEKYSLISKPTPQP